MRRGGFEGSFQFGDVRCGHPDTKDGQWLDSQKHRGKGHGVFQRLFAKVVHVEDFEGIARAMLLQQRVNLRDGGGGLKGRVAYIQAQFYVRAHACG